MNGFYMNATPIEEEILRVISEITRHLTEVLPKIPDAISAAATVAALVAPQWWVDGKRQEADFELARLNNNLAKFETCCTQECGKIVATQSLRAAADAYAAISFEQIFSQLDVKTMMGNREGWVSTNQQLYEAKVQPLESKLRGVKSGLDVLIDSLRTLDKTCQDRFSAVLMAMLNVALGVAGLATAVATAWTGVGAIVGIVVAILAFTSSVVALLSIPDVDAEIERRKDAVEMASDAVAKSRWPNAPSLVSESW